MSEDFNKEVRLRKSRKKDINDLRKDLADRERDLAVKTDKAADYRNRLNEAANAVDAWKKQNGVLRAKYTEWRQDCIAKDKALQQARAELAAAQSNAPRAFPADIDGPAQYFQNANSFNRDLRQQSFVPPTYRPSDTYGLYTPYNPPPLSTPFLDADLRRRQRSTTEYKPDNYVGISTSTFSGPVQSARNVDGYSLKLSKFAGKAGENFDAWYMAIISAIRSCPWLSDWAKIDFIRNLTEGEAFNNIAYRANPDYTVNKNPYKDD